MSEPQPDKVRFPLRAKLGLAAAALSALPLATLGAILLMASWDTFRDAHKRVHLAVASEIYSAFDGDLRSAQDAVDAAGLALTNVQIAPEARLGLASSIISGAEAVDHLAVYDKLGGLIDVIREKDATPPEAPARLDAPLRAQAEERGAALGSAVREGEAARVLLVLPYRAQGKVTSFGATWVDLGRVQRHLADEVGRVFGDADYEVFLLDSELRFLLHTRTEKVLQPAKRSGLFEGLEPKNLRNRTEVMARFEDAAGDYYGTLLTQPARGVAVGVIVPTQVVVGPVESMIRWTIGFVIGGILLGALLSALLARMLTKPLGQLADFAARLAQRSFDSRVEIQTADELHFVGEAMNQAAADLQESEERILKETAIRTDLGRYLPAEVVDKVVSREQDMELGGERREVSVLFADVVSFTPLTERLKPEETVGLLNELFTILTEIVFRHGGMVDKFIGDSVMAVFGAGADREDHAARALEAAEDMVRWLDVGNAKWQQSHGVKIEIAVGVNSGEVVIGNIGSSTRMEYTAIGEAVNLAARLESVARPQQILVGERTQALAEGFPFREAGEHRLPGMAEPVSLFALELE